MLDPCTLGRPFHLLDTFHQALQRRLARYLHARFNRRHGAALDVTGVSVVAAESGDDAPWRAFVTARDARAGLPDGTTGDDAADGRIAVRIERGLLIALLAWHYGDQPAAAPADLPAETETEQRFGVALALALADEFAACIAPLTASGCMPCPSTLPARPARGAHVVRVDVVNRADRPLVAREAGSQDAMPEVPSPALDHADDAGRPTEQGPAANPAPSPILAGAIEFALDDHWLARLFASVAPRRGQPPTSAGAGADTALDSRIPIRLTARMLTRDVPLDDVMRMAPGDVMPVRLPDTADVLVEGVCLYRAVVAEHGGTLCLTAFEELE